MCDSFRWIGTDIERWPACGSLINKEGCFRVNRWLWYFGDGGGWLGDGKVPIFNPVKHLLLDVTVLGIRGWPETSLQVELEN